MPISQHTEPHRKMYPRKRPLRFFYLIRAGQAHASLILCALDKAADPLVEKERYKAHKYALNNIERRNEKDCKCCKIRY